jgi:hypothetical protein
LKLSSFVAANALLYIGLGIAFGLYGPLLIAMFGVLETGGDAAIYWYVASFARLFGAALFGFGFLLWAIYKPLLTGEIQPAARRGITMALLLANLLALVVTLTQQVSIWGTLAGWIAAAICLVLSAGYAYFLVARSDQIETA